MSRAGKPNHRTLAFIQQYDALVQQYHDPVEVLFKMLGPRYKASIKIQAAGILVSYAFPKMIAAKVEVEAAEQMQLSWGAPTELEAPPILILDQINDENLQ